MGSFWGGGLIWLACGTSPWLRTHPRAGSAVTPQREELQQCRATIAALTAELAHRPTDPPTASSVPPLLPLASIRHSPCSGNLVVDPLVHENLVANPLASNWPTNSLARHLPAILWRSLPLKQSLHQTEECMDSVKVGTPHGKVS